MGQALLLRQILRQLGAPEPEPLFCTDDLVKRFLGWSEHTRKNQPRYVAEQKSYLGEWQSILDGVNLWDLDVGRDIVPRLPNKGRAPRIAALKVFLHYLRAELHLMQGHDPLADLHVPQARPAQLARSKVVSPEQIAATLRQLKRRWRDLVVVLLGTGWHLTELRRFVEAGRVDEPRPEQQRQRVRGVLVTRHKSGETHRTPVSRRVREAAERARERGRFATRRMTSAVYTAAARGKVVRWSPAWLRHTIATWALDHGADLGAVATFLGHRDARTTRRWYATHGTPKKVPTPL